MTGRISFKRYAVVSCGILEISDWMKLPIEPAAVSLDRFKGLLAAALDEAAG